MTRRPVSPRLASAVPALLLLAALAACQPPAAAPAGETTLSAGGPAGGSAAAGGTAAAAKAPATATLAGSVVLPTALVAAGGGNVIVNNAGNVIVNNTGNVIPTGGGHVIPTGGGHVIVNNAGNILSHNGAAIVAAGGLNLVAAGGGNLLGGYTGKYRATEAGAARRLLALDARPVEGAYVFLADAVGKPIPGLPVYRTDAAGRYEIPQVPAGYTVVVNVAVPLANGTGALFAALARTGDGVRADVSAASTLAAVRAAARLTGGDLGELDAGAFLAATAALAPVITEATLPDFRDPAAIGARAEAAEAASTAAQAQLDALRTQLAAKPTPIADLVAAVVAVAAAAPSPAAGAPASVDPAGVGPAPATSPTPGASPAPGATTSPAGSPAASAAPSAPPASGAPSTAPASAAPSPIGPKVATIGTIANARRLAVEPATGNLFAATGADLLAAEVTGSGPATFTPEGRAVQAVAFAGGVRFELAPDNTVTWAGNTMGAEFWATPTACVVKDGLAYVASRDHHAIYTIDLGSGQATLFAGGDPAAPGHVDAIGGEARFSQPGGITIGPGGFFVADTGNRRIRKVAFDGTVTTFAGNGASGATNGGAAAATFRTPTDVVADAVGTLFVADQGNHAIRRITPAGEVSTLVGGVAGNVDGIGDAARLTMPTSLALGRVGGEAVLFVGQDDGRVRVVTGF